MTNFNTADIGNTHVKYLRMLNGHFIMEKEINVFPLFSKGQAKVTWALRRTDDTDQYYLVSRNNNTSSATDGPEKKIKFP